MLSYCGPLRRQRSGRTSQIHTRLINQCCQPSKAWDKAYPTSTIATRTINHTTKTYRLEAIPIRLVKIPIATREIGAHTPSFAWIATGSTDMKHARQTTCIALTNAALGDQGRGGSGARKATDAKSLEFMRPEPTNVVFSFRELPAYRGFIGDVAAASQESAERSRTAGFATL